MMQSERVMTDDLTGRAYWLNAMQRIAEPLLLIAAERRILSHMPKRFKPGVEARTEFFGVEAVGRLLDGIAPWLELDGLEGTEAELQSRYRHLSVKAISAIVDLESPDRCDFNSGLHFVVDAAFLASALVRAPKALASALPPGTRAQLIEDFCALRKEKPFYNNWLLFSAVIELCLHQLKVQWDPMRLDYAMRQHEQWYMGDGVYGDGPDFHADYYNSFVIQPMILLIRDTLDDSTLSWLGVNSKALDNRAMRYAEIQERQVAPDGTYPILGRSITYRFGAFQHLALMALREALPKQLKPSQVRCALEAVIRRTMDAPGSAIFDQDGFLKIGLVNEQPDLGEPYISTASCYLCSEVFLPLGLSAEHDFWTQPDLPWTCKKAWGGDDVAADKAYRDH